MVDKQGAAETAKEFLRSETSGVLSTQSRVLDGYPFGSVVPYCLDTDGYPVILISHIAQHTRNIEKNSKVSLTVTEAGVDDVQTGARLTWVGDAEKTSDPDSISRYYRFFPESRDYHKTHNFEFYRIIPVRSRYIGGFGDIHWLENHLMVEANPLAGEVEESVVTHMNQDHQDSIRTYCRQFDIDVPEGIQPEMSGVDPSGFYLKVGKRVVRIPFAERVETVADIRRLLVQMVRAA